MEREWKVILGGGGGGGGVVTENTQGIHRLSIPTQDRLDLW